MGVADDIFSFARSQRPQSGDVNLKIEFPVNASFSSIYATVHVDFVRDRKPSVVQLQVRSGSIARADKSPSRREKKRFLPLCR